MKYFKDVNTHAPSFPYKAHTTEEARRIIKRLVIHYTPKHRSWLDIAEIELNVMTWQCLSRQISSIEYLQRKLSVWENKRNSKQAGVNWQFKTKDARIKLTEQPILPSAVLASIDVATATSIEAALQSDNIFCPVSSKNAFSVSPLMFLPSDFFTDLLKNGKSPFLHRKVHSKKLKIPLE